MKYLFIISTAFIICFIPIVISSCVKMGPRTAVVRDKHFACMLMCEKTRDNGNLSDLDVVQQKVEKYCYEQCNKTFGKECN